MVTELRWIYGRCERTVEQLVTRVARTACFHFAYLLAKSGEEMLSAQRLALLVMILIASVQGENKGIIASSVES